MNLYHIKNIAEKQGVLLKDLAETIGMSYQNLNRCVRENKIMANDLEKISKALNIPISFFFEENLDEKKIMVGNNQVNVSSQNVQQNNNHAENLHALELFQKEIEGLKKEIELKDKIIAMLENK